MSHDTQNPVASDAVMQEAAAIEVADGKTPGIRPRRSAEERLQRALARRQAIQEQIVRLKTEMDDKNRKERNRALTLIGVVVEQCLKEGVFASAPKVGQAWWQAQATRLQEKDRDTYQRFLQSISTGADDPESDDLS